MIVINYIITYEYATSMHQLIDIIIPFAQPLDFQQLRKLLILPHGIVKLARVVKVHSVTPCIY